VRITEVVVASLQADGSPELGRKSAMAHGFRREEGQHGEGGWRSLPGIPLSQSISGGPGRRSATSSANLGCRGGPPVVRLLRKWSKRSRRVTTELDQVLTGLEDQQNGVVALGLELYSCDGENVMGASGVSFIGLGVRVGEVQRPESKSQLNRGLLKSSLRIW
jgi:hypothetical protein